MFASEDNSVNVERHEPAARSDRWDQFVPRMLDDVDEAPAGVARRLHGRLDRHLWLLARMQADPLQSQPAGFAELLDTARRLRRDAESLLLLYGLDPGRRTDEPRRLSDVLGDAAAAADQPRRVDVRPVPAATVTPVAATELLHVLAELIDHVTGAYPAARVEVISRAEPRGGILIDVRADGPGSLDPDELAGRRALAAAARLAQRSRNGIAVRTPPGEAGAGPVASVHCPSSVVTIRGLERPPVSDLPAREPRLPTTIGADLPRRDPPPPPSLPPSLPPPSLPPPAPAFDERPADRPFGEPILPAASERPLAELSPSSVAADPISVELSLPAVATNIPLEPPFPPVSSTNGGSREEPVAEPASALLSPLSSPSLPARVPAGSSRVDELFGPLVDIPHSDSADTVATPIFEAIASAWFRDDPANANGRGNGNGSANANANGRNVNGSGGVNGNGNVNGNGRAVDWETPMDGEWRAAAARAAAPEENQLTSTGLPRRRPGNQLVPPRMRTPSHDSAPAERVPDRVRDRLSGYQRGLRQGRHRAESRDGEPRDSAW